MSTEATVQHKPSQKKKEPPICPKAQRERFFSSLSFCIAHYIYAFSLKTDLWFVWGLDFFKLNFSPFAENLKPFMNTDGAVPQNRREGMKWLIL